MRCNGSNWAVYSPGSWDGFRNDVWALWAGVIMRLEHHLVGGYVRYISPHIIIYYLLWDVNCNLPVWLTLGLQISGSNPAISAVSPDDEDQDTEMETGTAALVSPTRVVGKPPVAGVAAKKKQTKSWGCVPFDDTLDYFKRIISADTFCLTNMLIRLRKFTKYWCWTIVVWSDCLGILSDRSVMIHQVVL